MMSGLIFLQAIWTGLGSLWLPHPAIPCGGLTLIRLESSPFGSAVISMVVSAGEKSSHKWETALPSNLLGR